MLQGAPNNQNPNYIQKMAFLFAITGVCLAIVAYFYAVLPILVTSLLAAAILAMAYTVFGLFNRQAQTAPQQQANNRGYVITPHLQALINQQQNTYQQVFLANPQNFHQPIHHYDWWMFPITAHSGATATSHQYSVNDQEVRVLLNHQQFITTYIDSVGLYLHNLEQYGWNQYDIRYEKMLRSLEKFILQSNSITTNAHRLAVNQPLKQLAARAIAFAQVNHINGPRIPDVLNSLALVLNSSAYTPNYNAPQDDRSAPQQAADPHSTNRPRKGG